MSGELRVNNITDEAGTGSPDFPNGVDAGVLTGTLPAIDGSNLTGDIPASRITDALNATGSAPIYACRAWVNFDGTGTVAIRESGNVSSITDNGTGDYTINFSTAMEDLNYAFTLSTTATGTGGPVLVLDRLTTPSTTQLRLQMGDTSNVKDVAFNCVAIFR